MERYREWYVVTSFFLDEADTDPESLELYRTVIDYVHAMGGTAILNFGFVPHPSYMEVGDYVITFEDSARLRGVRAPGLGAGLPGGPLHPDGLRRAQGPDRHVLAKTRAGNAGFVWITDDHIDSGSPYNTLPTYWSAHNEQLSEGCD